MKFKATIKKDGNIITEVIDRENTNCSSIRTFTNSLGTETSDEHIGPECDDVHEVAAD